MASGLPPRLFLERIRLLICKEQITKAEEELRKSESLHSTDADGSTTLHHAALDGDFEIVRWLLDAGLQADKTDAFGYTALHRAAAQGHREVMQVLTERGCNVNLQDAAHGFTALHEAAWHGYSDSVTILVRAGANVHVVNKAGFSALHLAAQHGHNQTARILLACGANPDARNIHGDTALHTAARYGHAGVTRILISARASVNQTNENGDTPLHIAAALKRRKVAQFLIDAQVDYAARNRQDDTAMDIAARKGHTHIVEVLQNLSQNQPLSTRRPEVSFSAVNSTANNTAASNTTNVADAKHQKEPKVVNKSGKRGFFASLFKRSKKSSKRESTANVETSKNSKSPGPAAPVPPVPVPAPAPAAGNNETLQPPVVGWPPVMYPHAPYYVPPPYGYMTHAMHPAVLAYYSGELPGQQPGHPAYQLPPHLPAPARRLRPPQTPSQTHSLTKSSGRLQRSLSDDSLSMSDSKAKANDERARVCAMRELQNINQYYQYANTKHSQFNLSESGVAPVVGRRGAQNSVEQLPKENRLSAGLLTADALYRQTAERKRQTQTRRRVPADIDDEDEDEDVSDAGGTVHDRDSVVTADRQANTLLFDPKVSSPYAVMKPARKNHRLRPTAARSVASDNGPLAYQHAMSGGGPRIAMNRDLKKQVTYATKELAQFGAPAAYTQPQPQTQQKQQISQTWRPRGAAPVQMTPVNIAQHNPNDKSAPFTRCLTSKVNFNPYATVSSGRMIPTESQTLRPSRSSVKPPMSGTGTGNGNVVASGKQNDSQVQSQPASAGNRSDNSNPDSGYASQLHPPVTAVFPPSQSRTYEPEKYNNSMPTAGGNATNNQNNPALLRSALKHQYRQSVVIQTTFDTAALINMSTEV